MARTGEDYENAAKDAEKNDQLHQSVDDYFAAEKQYAKEGKADKSAKMREEAIRVLKKGIDDGVIGEGDAQGLETAAKKLEDKAKAQLTSDTPEGKDGATELYAAAAEIRDRAGIFWYELAASESEPETAASQYDQAAKDFAQAAGDLETAARNEPATEKEQKEAKQEYHHAKVLREVSAGAHNRAAGKFRDAAKDQREAAKKTSDKTEQDDLNKAADDFDKSAKSQDDQASKEIGKAADDQQKAN